MGGDGSHVVLPDARLTGEHVFLRVSRGRVMVEPGRGAAYLDGERIRAITPLYADEELLLGETVLQTERFVDEEPVIATHFGGNGRPCRIDEKICSASCVGWQPITSRSW